MNDVFISMFAVQISQPPIGDIERQAQHRIRELMYGVPDPMTIRSRGALLLDLARELREIRENMEEHGFGGRLTCIYFLKKQKNIS